MMKKHIHLITLRGYPYFPVLRTKVPAEPGDDIDVIVRKEDLFTWSITIYNPYREPSSVTYPFETEDLWPGMFYAHFIKSPQENSSSLVGR